MFYWRIYRGKHIYFLSVIFLHTVEDSLSKIPTIGCNPIDGCTSNYWMQKHPIAGCINLYKCIADIGSHWEVAPNIMPVVQAINKYFNATSNSDIIFPKNINCIHKSV